MNNQQQQYHGAPPPQHQYQGSSLPNAQQQLNSSPYGQRQNQSSPPPQQQYQNPPQAYQGHPQYNQYQSSSFHQPPPNQYQQASYRPQPQQAPQHVPQQQPTAQFSSTAQAASVGNLPRSNTPGQATTPTYSSSNQLAPGGAPARQYINETVAPYLLGGMKMLVREQPSDPLRVLGEWLIEQNSKRNENEML